MKARHTFAVFLAAATFLLVIAGGLVTSTGSGLAVPDWPLSFGQVFPRMEGGVLYEHGHRLIAATVGLLTVILAAWTARTEPRRSIRLLGWAMLGAVILQGLLGGMTVLLRLPDAVSIAHAGLAQIFFALTVVMADNTGAGSRMPGPGEGTAVPSTQHPTPSTLITATAVLIYVQILIGAVVRHTGAGLAIPTFPLANGRIIPEITTSLVAWQFAHRVMALVVAVMVFVTTARVVRHGAASLRRPALLLSVLVVWQIFLGGLTIWTFRAVTPTTAHVASGALLWVTSVVLAVRARAGSAP